MPEALRCRGLRVRRGKRVVLHDVDLDAPRGQVTAILGPNGAGKSTLLRALAGLLSFEGSVHVGGRALSELDRIERARSLAFVPQQSLLASSLPVRRVVAQGRFPHRRGLGGLTRADHDAVAKAMARADVQPLADRPFTRLSFGEQRRVLLARGLATGADVLLLDEPAASLDIAHALSLYALLRELAEDGHGVIVVLHHLDAALQHTDHALLLNEGHAVAHGPTPEVIGRGTVRHVYGVEMIEGGGLGFARCAATS